MNLTKYQQSGFVCELVSGTRVAWDIARFTPIESLVDVRVDIAIVSHIHGDHFSPEHLLALQPKLVLLNQQCQDALPADFTIPTEVVRPGTVWTNDELEVTFFEVDHGPNATGELYDNMGFVLTADGQNIYFAGDMYTEPAELVGSDYDVALIPVGTFYTFGPSEGYAFAERLQAKLTIPMHYDIKNLQAGEEFIDLATDLNTKLLEVQETLEME